MVVARGLTPTDTWFAVPIAETAQYGMQYVVYQQGMPYAAWGYGYYPYNTGVIPFSSGESAWRPI
jgi:hypothetical protein